MNNNQEQPLTTLENRAQYEAWVQELRELQNLNGEEQYVDWEYIESRIQALSADIVAYEQCHAIIASVPVDKAVTDDETYWNTVATTYDEEMGYR